MYRPLADEIRPSDLSQVVGQTHILGSGGILRRIIESGEIPNMVFYGPSGTGKTTVANIIARRTNRTLRKLNATTAGIADIKSIIAELDTMLTPGGVLLYLDEIQYFNKKQQQSLLEFIEDGRITLVASTTENPYFYVYNALLSRSTVFEFKQIPPDQVLPAVLRAIGIMEEREGVTAELESGAAEHIAQGCGGDVRKAVNAVELLFSAAPRRGGKVGITLSDVKAVSQRSAMRYDREALSGPASGGGRSARRLPADTVLRQRGYRPGISAGRAHCQSLCGQRPSAWPSGGAPAVGGGCDPAGNLSQVEFGGFGYRQGDGGCARGQNRPDPQGDAERPRRRRRI